ncbi:YdcF family protein [Kovacikia minuta CCNUW1]|uniref:YdcF family protein n=1 Tax=Kovacikia minuta TaxID=2931930 RepID=UPI001CCCA3F9|nr:YdcF family protein [Kovacikia minuta]UBF26599.1 YdcF family protein [Kovacikia minuta CCNUW1]
MVLLLTDVFLLLTQVLLWLVVGLIAWFVLLKLLPKPFLGMLVLLLILAVLGLSFFMGPPPTTDVLGVIWRIISFPFTPLGLIIILLLVLLTGKPGKIARRFIVLGLLVLALGSIPFFSYYLVQELELEGIEQIQALPRLEGGGRRVIVLIGQGTTRLQLRPRQGDAPATDAKAVRPISSAAFDVLARLPIQLTNKGNRLIYAAQLYQEETQAGTNPLILVSAGTRPYRLQREGEKKENISEAIDIRTFLTQTMRVPEGSITLEHDGTTVRRSAENVKKLLDDQRINYGGQVTVVTTAMNMHRTALTFKDVFGDAAINSRPTDFYTLPPPERLGKLLQGNDLISRQLLASDFLPSAEAFCASTEAIEEYLASIYYFLRGWIRPLS